MAESIKIIKDETPQWLNRKGNLVKISDMTDAQLKTAKLYAQSRILHYHNKASLFDLKVDELEQEAESRKVELPDYDREFFRNQRMLEKSK